jgi:hypothetical protein
MNTLYYPVFLTRLGRKAEIRQTLGSLANP